jgi:hypothetical protein
MLEVALVFSCTEEEARTFEQPDWESEIRGYFKLDAIKSTPDRGTSPKPTSWLFGCLQRIRAFGIYDKSDRQGRLRKLYEPAIAPRFDGIIVVVTLAGVDLA